MYGCMCMCARRHVGGHVATAERQCSARRRSPCGAEWTVLSTLPRRRSGIVSTVLVGQARGLRVEPAGGEMPGWRNSRSPRRPGVSGGGCNLIWACMRPDASRALVGAGACPSCLASMLLSVLGGMGRITESGAGGRAVGVGASSGVAPPSRLFEGVSSSGAPCPSCLASTLLSVSDAVCLGRGARRARANPPVVCVGARGREANHACGEVGLMSCGAVARAARSARAERSADIDFT